jgi:hypothetical protein
LVILVRVTRELMPSLQAMERFSCQQRFIASEKRVQERFELHDATPRLGHAVTDTEGHPGGERRAFFKEPGLT